MPNETIKKNDLCGLALWIARSLNYKLGLFLFMLVIFIFDEWFVINILQPIGLGEHNQPTLAGSFAQYLLIAIMAIVIDFVTRAHDPPTLAEAKTSV